MDAIIDFLLRHLKVVIPVVYVLYWVVKEWRRQGSGEAKKEEGRVEEGLEKREAEIREMIRRKREERERGSVIKSEEMRRGIEVVEEVINEVKEERDWKGLLEEAERKLAESVGMRRKAEGKVLGGIGKLKDEGRIVVIRRGMSREELRRGVIMGEVLKRKF